MRDRVSPVLIGRNDALELALRRWRGAADGRGELLLVAGESGIGKTRLLAEIVAQIGVPSPRAAGRPREMDAPGELIYGLADDLRRLGRTEQAARLRQRLLDEADGAGDATRKRRLLLGDLAQIILDLLDEEPVLLRFDDLHWADELSLDVLERVAQNLDTSHSLVIGTYRTDELFAGSRLRSWRARLLEQRLAEEVRLPRLDKADIAELVEAITGERPASTVVESLQRRSDGIPLHIEELLAADSESAVLETVGEAVAARLEQLEPSRREIVSAASVIGREFDVRLLEEITTASQESVAEALRAASELHIVVQHLDAQFGFRHSIVCDVTYGEIPVARRANLHAAVAGAAARIGLGAAFISEHYERAGEYGLAHEHALVAARDAIRVSAHREAAELLARAERTTPEDTPAAERAHLLSQLATELAAIDEVDAAATRFHAAIELHHALGDDVAAARLVPESMAMRHLLGDDLETRAAMALDALDRLDRHPAEHSSRARAGLLGALSAAHMLDRRLAESLDYGERAIALLDQSEPMALDVRLSMGATLVFAGRGDEGWAMLEGAIGAAQEAGLEAVASRGFRMIGSSASVLLQYERALAWLTEGLRYTAEVERWNDHHYLQAHRGHVRWATGDWVGAEESARHAITDGVGITTQITALHVLGYLALTHDRLADARTHLEQARELGERMHELQRVSPALWGLAELALREGRPADAIELSELGFTESERVMDAAYLYPYVITATRALLAQRDTTAARDWITRCTRLIEERSIPGTSHAVAHAQGLVELAEGRPTEARALIEAATEGWIAFDRRWEAVHGLVDLARCARRSKRAADAARLTTRALELAAGAELLVSVATPATADDASPLSARELEVARLVADGATNREIAERLVIAPKTASAHIEHILAKLGVSRRAEIAAWVAAADGEPSARH
jgi:DNA-binding CsgD family transcriptional regulator